MFENYRKSLIQHCERSELRLHFEWTKVNQKWSILASFLKLEACGQTLSPGRSVLIVKKSVENAKIQKFKCNILSNFQTICQILEFNVNLNVAGFACNVVIMRLFWNFYLMKYRINIDLFTSLIYSQHSMVGTLCHLCYENHLSVNHFMLYHVGFI